MEARSSPNSGLPSPPPVVPSGGDDPFKGQTARTRHPGSTPPRQLRVGPERRSRACEGKATEVAAGVLATRPGHPLTYTENGFNSDLGPLKGYPSELSPHRVPRVGRLGRGGHRPPAVVPDGPKRASGCSGPDRSRASEDGGGSRDPLPHLWSDGTVPTQLPTPLSLSPPPVSSSSHVARPTSRCNGTPTGPRGPDRRVEGVKEGWEVVTVSVGEVPRATDGGSSRVRQPQLQPVEKDKQRPSLVVRRESAVGPGVVTVARAVTVVGEREAVPTTDKTHGRAPHGRDTPPVAREGRAHTVALGRARGVKVSGPAKGRTGEVSIPRTLYLTRPPPSSHQTRRNPSPRPYTMGSGRTCTPSVTIS